MTDDDRAPMSFALSVMATGVLSGSLCVPAAA
jgi:hypothetical protein